MVVLKLSRLYEQLDVNSDYDKWLETLVEKIKTDGGIQLIEDVPYRSEDSRVKRKEWLQEQGLKDIRFRAIEQRQEKEIDIRGNPKTFREFFLGKHPECDIKILGIYGEKYDETINRLTQCMADYMDYIAERVTG